MTSKSGYRLECLEVRKGQSVAYRHTLRLYNAILGMTTTVTPETPAWMIDKFLKETAPEVPIKHRKKVLDDDFIKVVRAVS